MNPESSEVVCITYHPTEVQEIRENVVIQVCIYFYLNNGIFAIDCENKNKNLISPKNRFIFEKMLDPKIEIRIFFPRQLC